MKRLATAAILPLSVFVLLSASAPARAQDDGDGSVLAQRRPAQSQGPLVLQPIRNAWVIAPDVKVTKVDGTSSTLVGAYGGYLLEQTVLIGAGGYWLADGSRNRGMSYGGLVVGYFLPAGERVRFGARGLVGFGIAKLTREASIQEPGPLAWQGGMMPWGDRHMSVIIGTFNGRFRQDFFIAEPQADLTIRLARRIALDVAAGYRFIGAAHGFERDLRGATGSVAVRFGG